MVEFNNIWYNTGAGERIPCTFCNRGAGKKPHLLNEKSSKKIKIEKQK